MTPEPGSVQALLSQPMAYLHPQRLKLASGVDTPQLRAAIETMLNAQAPGCDDVQLQSPIARLWFEHWRLLPQVASLLGAHMAKADLARGGRLMRLSRSESVFARYAPGLQTLSVRLDDSPLGEQLQALGLNLLLAFDEQVPRIMRERLVLQFPESVVTRQCDLPTGCPDVFLLILALQHARFFTHHD